MDAAVTELAERILDSLPFDPNDQQTMLIAALARFVAAPAPARERVFVLNGYAGTGKTSLVSALVRALDSMSKPVVLLAPTGRAAKVFGQMAGHPASTIHRRIYRGDLLGIGMPSGPVVNVNRLKEAVYIVDEASMIGDDTEGDLRRGSLLDDLVEYVFSQPGSSMILLGDPAQLPPVGLDISPALDVARLKRGGMTVSRAVMTEVVRQQLDSGILYNATRLRRSLRRRPLAAPRFSVRRFPDIRIVEGTDLIDEVAAAYSDDGIENTLLVTRSNRSATAANMAIRNSVLYSEEEICRGERLMIAKNNYLWTLPREGLDFIANGDIATIEAIHSTENLHGFRFADVALTLPHAGVTIDCKVILDALVADTPALPADAFQRLYMARLEQATDPMRTLPQRRAQLRRDPYLNALQVKYAYAVTCHKAQGGQWKNVMVDLSGLSTPSDAPEAEMVNLYRWLYTAFTRATTRLYLINPPESWIC